MTGAFLQGCGPTPRWAIGWVGTSAPATKAGTPRAAAAKAGAVEAAAPKWALAYIRDSRRRADSSRRSLAGPSTSLTESRHAESSHCVACVMMLITVTHLRSGIVGHRLPDSLDHEPKPRSRGRATCLLPSFSRPSRADHGLLDHGDHAFARGVEHLPARQPSRPSGPRRLLRVEQPLVGPERPVEPHRV